MDYAQYQSLSLAAQRVIRGKDLKNQTPRTLLWGYDTDRNSWHVYLEFSKIITLRYSYHDKLISAYPEDQIGQNENYVPNKRLYPEACDFEFSAILKSADIYLPWTTFNTERAQKAFYGLRLEEFAHLGLQHEI